MTKTYDGEVTTTRNQTVVFNYLLCILAGILIAVAFWIAFAPSGSYDDGFKDGKASVCDSPQVPFKTVELPACE